MSPSALAMRLDEKRSRESFAFISNEEPKTLNLRKWMCSHDKDSFDAMRADNRQCLTIECHVCFPAVDVSFVGYCFILSAQHYYLSRLTKHKFDVLWGTDNI